MKTYQEIMIMTEIQASRTGVYYGKATPFTYIQFAELSDRNELSDLWKNWKLSDQPHPAQLEIIESNNRFRFIGGYRTPDIWVSYLGINTIRS